MQGHAIHRALSQEALLADVDEAMARTARWTGRASLTPRVRAALARVPRAEFVPEDLRRFAQSDSALPIGCGQTISQPFIVALMTDLLAPEPSDVVLEVGTGSGYQAAVLAELARAVYTIEILPPLADRARATLERLRYGHVRVAAGDGWDGWPEHAPYDGILVTAVAPRVPPPLLEQLAPGGRLVLPLLVRHGGQQLVVVEKDPHGQVRRESVLPVVFVPLTGEHGASEA